MGEVINLRQVRKAREKAEKAAQAEVNRIAFGQSKATKTLAKKREALEVARIDGNRLDDPDQG